MSALLISIPQRRGSAAMKQVSVAGHGGCAERLLHRRGSSPWRNANRVLGRHHRQRQRSSPRAPGDAVRSRTTTSGFGGDPGPFPRARSWPRRRTAAHIQGHLPGQAGDVEGARGQPRHPGGRSPRCSRGGVGGVFEGRPFWVRTGSHRPGPGPHRVTVWQPDDRGPARPHQSPIAGLHAWDADPTPDPPPRPRVAVRERCAADLPGTRPPASVVGGPPVLPSRPYRRPPLSPHRGVPDRPFE